MNKIVDAKRQEINTNIRYIGYNVFGSKQGGLKFVSAYDKLCAYTYAKYDFRVSDATVGSQGRDNNMFDTLDGRDIDIVLESSRQLRKMYEDIKAKMIA